MTIKNCFPKFENWNTVFERCNFLRPIYKKVYTLKNGLLIKNNRRFITRKCNKDKVYSFDTETYKGKCKLIALSSNNLEKAIFKMNPTFDDCLEFLMFNSSDSSYYRFFYNIDFDISAIMKLWNNKKMIKKLLLGISVKYKEYTMTWLKGRMFILKKKHHSCYFTDLFTFFKIGLNKASKDFIGKIEKDNIDGNKLNNSLSYWKKNEKDIIKYCKKDCLITSLLGYKLIDSINEAKIELPNYLVSPASLAKSDFRFHCRIDKISHIPQQVLQIAYDCYFGGRFEIFKRGYFNKLYLYDINSQYPSFIRKLPNMKYGCFRYTNIQELAYRFRKRDNYRTYFETKKFKMSNKEAFIKAKDFMKKYKLPKREKLGYYKVILEIPDNVKIPTIPIKHKGIIKFPVGYIEKWLTWYDLDLVREYIIEIKEFYIYHPDNNKKKPNRTYKLFQERIDFHYANKSKYKKTDEKLKYNISKLTMNSLYGCFIEQHENYNKDNEKIINAGMLFNSFYASQITAFGRWSVIKDVRKIDYKHIVAIHTDSIITDKKLDYLKIDDKIGNWNLETEGKSIMINTGMYQIGYINKTRGIPLKEIKTWLRFCLKNENIDKKEFKIRHIKKIREGLIQDKSLEKVNTISLIKKSVNINSDSKRDWFSNFKNFKDVLSRNIDSLPYMCISHDFNDFELHPNYLVCQMK